MEIILDYTYCDFDPNEDLTELLKNKLLELRRREEINLIESSPLEETDGVF